MRSGLKRASGADAAAIRRAAGPTSRNVPQGLIEVIGAALEVPREPLHRGEIGPNGRRREICGAGAPPA